LKKHEKLAPKPSPRSVRSASLALPVKVPNSPGHGETPSSARVGGGGSAPAPALSPTYLRSWIRQVLTLEFGEHESRRIVRAIPDAVLKKVKVRRES